MIKNASPILKALRAATQNRAAIFEPGTYNLKAPSAQQRLDRHTKSEHSGHRTGKKHRKHHLTANIRESAKTPK